MVAATRAMILATGFQLLLPRAEATVEMQNQAKKLGFAVGNCLYCHASPHAAEAMRAKARELRIQEGNCLACHGGDIPAALNQRGDWLVAQKAARGAKAWDMAWLKDYKEPTPEARAKPKPTPTPKDVVKVIPNP